MASILTRGFLLPGDLVSNLIGISRSDDRGMMRTLINMLFWNLVGAFVALYFA
ncbi:hypothetical protein [Alsobacter soli]|uniref:hypothetical protein n=1 Tax=Alsobacter soli TaxID=2109933 RepID=UPI0018AD5316|nr:hypothetical protein [Alsobacter soli]